MSKPRTITVTSILKIPPRRVVVANMTRFMRRNASRQRISIERYTARMMAKLAAEDDPEEALVLTLMAFAALVREDVLSPAGGVQ